MDHRRSQPVTLEALRAYFPDGKFAGRLQPMPQYGCMYVKNAKSGSSTLLLWLHRIHTGDHEFARANIHKHHQLPTPGSVGWDTVVKMLNGEAFRFSFVRDPIARLQSAYLDKVANTENKNPWRRRRRVHRALGVEGNARWLPTFEEFIAALEEQDPLLMDPHWRPQHLNLMHPLVEYDFIGRLENFEADLERVREATGMPVIPMQVRNVRPPAESLFDGRPDLLRRAREVYAGDLELYGY
jgi:Sulfotransferase family